MGHFHIPLTQVVIFFSSHLKMFLQFCFVSCGCSFKSVILLIFVSIFLSYCSSIQASSFISTFLNLPLCLFHLYVYFLKFPISQTIGHGWFNVRYLVFSYWWTCAIAKIIPSLYLYFLTFSLHIWIFIFIFPSSDEFDISCQILLDFLMLLIYTLYIYIYIYIY